jgi:glutamate--cysteine ligase
MFLYKCKGEKMNTFNKNLINLINNKALKKYLMHCSFGLEKENVRVDKDGKLVFTPHPKAFGNPLTNPNIKTDFSESQVEVVTPVCDTIEETYEELKKLHNKVSSQLDNEYLWPQSNPPYLPENKEIPIAKLDKRDEEEFREVLARKYGRKKQLISGIHYNFSFKEEFFKSVYEELSNGENYTEFKNKIYLKICRGFLKYRWMPIYFTGASPVFHSTFIEEYIDKGCSLDEESYYFPNMISLRNSDYGYKNRENFYVSYDTVEDYVRDIDLLVEQEEIQDICEYYAPVRLKTGNNDNLSRELVEQGIRYFEIRILDLNPLCEVGINIDILYIIHLFVLFVLFKEDEEFTLEDHNIANMNAELIATCGRDKKLYIYENLDTKVQFKEKALDILKDMEDMLKLIQCHSEYFMQLINAMRAMVENPDNAFSNRLFHGIKEKSFIDFHMDKAKEYLADQK